MIGKPYLLLIAFLLIVSNLVNTTGEFILGKDGNPGSADGSPTRRRGVCGATRRSAPAVQQPRRKKVQNYIARFYGDFLFTVSLAGVLAQLFLVSRIMKLCGVPASLYFLPVIALTGYSIIAFFPRLGVRALGQGRGKQHRLLAAKHRAPGVVFADDAGGEI